MAYPALPNLDNGQLHYHTFGQPLEYVRFLPAAGDDWLTLPDLDNGQLLYQVWNILWQLLYQFWNILIDSGWGDGANSWSAFLGVVNDHRGGDCCYPCPTKKSKPTPLHPLDSALASSFLPFNQ